MTKRSNSIRTKYFWPGIAADVKRLVEACNPCQLHRRAQQRELNRPALEHVSRPMKAICIEFFRQLKRWFATFGVSKSIRCEPSGELGRSLKGSRSGTNPAAERS